MFQKKTITKTNIIRQSYLIDIFNTYKIIYREIVFICFELNEFNFNTMKIFEYFIIIIKFKYRWQLTRVILNYVDKTLARIVKQFVRYVDLQKFTLNIDEKSIHYIVSYIYIIIYEKKNLFRVRELKKFRFIFNEKLETLLRQNTKRMLKKFKKKFKNIKESQNFKTIRKLEKKNFWGKK